MDEIAALLARSKPYYEMDKDEYNDVINAMLANVKYRAPYTNEGYPDEDMSRSAINARGLAGIALDRGLPMFQPQGAGRTFTDEQYIQAMQQYRPVNKLFTQQEDIAARANLAGRMAQFKNELHQRPVYDGFGNYLRQLLGM
jgi:hypothetical protein